jgi:HAD superfamily hydrolase (TIGR01509 family)
MKDARGDPFVTAQATSVTSPPPDQIQALIFDLFGVLIAFDDRLVYDRIAQRCAQPSTAAEHLRDLVSKPDLICGRMTLRQLHARLVRDLAMNASLDEFEAIWLAPYSEPMPGMRELLRQLSRQCRLVLLSNVDRYYWSTIEASLPELRDFDAKVLSFEQGVAKPDALAFERAVAASGVPVDQCYFVDDKPENMAAAAAIGLAGHTFQSCRALKVALRERGLSAK